eukprot:3049116-Amphidinium_carterae.1
MFITSVFGFVHKRETRALATFRRRTTAFSFKSCCTLLKHAPGEEPGPPCCAARTLISPPAKISSQPLGKCVRFH